MTHNYSISLNRKNVCFLLLIIKHFRKKIMLFWHSACDIKKNIWIRKAWGLRTLPFSKPLMEDSKYSKSYKKQCCIYAISLVTSFGVVGTPVLHSLEMHSIKYHCGVNICITLEIFQRIVTSWSALVENIGVYQMYCQGNGEILYNI